MSSVTGSTTYPIVYYVKDSDAPTAPAVLAICPRIYKSESGESRISWRNTTIKGLDFKIIKFANEGFNKALPDKLHPPQEISIVTENGKVLTLRVLTKEVYEKQMTNMFNKPQFATDEELQKYWKDYDPEYEMYKNM